MSEVTEKIKTEYNNLVNNVEQLRTDINYLDNFISNMNKPEIQSPTLITEPQPAPIPAPIPAPAPATQEQTIQEEKKEELLEALVDPNKQQTKSNKQLLADQKEEMNDRKTNIENALIKMAQNIKTQTINQDKTQAWDLLKKTNKDLEEYLSTTLFYDIKRYWSTYSQQIWNGQERYLNMFLQSYNDLNLCVGRNQYFKDIMRKHLNKETLPTEDLQFIYIKNQIDDAYNGIIQMKNNSKGGNKTRKYRKQHKSRKYKSRKYKSIKQRGKRGQRKHQKSNRKQ
jgi:hypothetical protein